MDSAAMRALLAQAGTIAVLGAKDTPGQPVDRVGRYLIEAGYRVIPVHPKRREVWGLPVRPRLADIDEPVDIIDVFRAPQYCLEHAREALAMRPLPRLFWMQSGIAHAGAASLLARQGLSVVENACLMVEHKRLFL